jgi:agmatine/peptidylarginine deiminase
MPSKKAPTGLLSRGLVFTLALLALLAAGQPALAAHPGAPITNPPEENSLPIGMTTEEEATWWQIGTYTRDTAPPPGPGIRQCAEWEPVTGALVRYPFGLSNSLLKEIADNIELWILVASSSEQTTVTSSLTAAGVNMANVRFQIAATNSIWTRDYGPQFMFDANGDQGIVDHHYNRPRPLDDVVSYAVGTTWDVPVYGSPLIHTGGNYMCDGHGLGHSTTLVYDDNSISDAQVDGYMLSYLGIQTYRAIPDIQISGIHHIDCWAKFLNEETILVKQVASGNTDYTRIESGVATMRTWTSCYGRPYRIVRIFCPSISGGVAAYTNGVILNNKVLVPLFSTSYDAAALQTYQDALPGYEVVGFTGSWLSDDAVHCRVMGIHDKYMLRVDVKPLPDTLSTPGDVRLGAVIDDRSEAGLKADSLLAYWRVTGSPSFTPVQMTAAATPDSFYAYIPAQAPGSTVEYYVLAADQSNRRSTRPPSAPLGWFKFFVGADPSDVTPMADGHGLELSPSRPNPFSGAATITFGLPAQSRVDLAVVDIRGRVVRNLLQSRMPAGRHMIRWDGRDAAGREAPNGLYLFRLQADGRTLTQRGVLIR